MLSSSLLTGPRAAAGLLPPAPPRVLLPARLRAPTRGTARIVRLSGARFRVYAFETRRRGEPADCPPRTVGQAALLLDHRPAGLAAVGPDEAAALCLRAAGGPPPAEAAKEKVAFCGPGGETRVYQADREKATAALCACGNAAGAAAATLAQCLGRRRVRQDLLLPDGPLAAQSRVTWAAGHGWRVEQSWAGIRFQVREAELLGRPVAVCAGSLNDYLIVRLPDAAALEEFGLDDALALWGVARAFGGFGNPLQSRLAAVAPRDGEPALARFYTCGRMHPGAPLTGLAALALAAGQVGWLADALRGGAVQVRRGVDALPSARPAVGGFEVTFPTIDVTLRAG
jgi:hypothetical protein